MLTPGPAELLAGVADALATTVLPDLADGPARDQLHAAIAIIRKTARALPGFAMYLHEDIADLAESLAGLGAPAELLATARALPPTSPSLDELAAIDLALRTWLAGRAAESAGDQTATPVSGDAQHTMVALLARLTEREAALRLSPWER